MTKATIDVWVELEVHIHGGDTYEYGQPEQMEPIKTDSFEVGSEKDCIQVMANVVSQDILVKEGMWDPDYTREGKWLWEFIKERAG